MTESEYWKQRCLLSEKCNEESPCDPDITDAQVLAWSEYHDFIKNNQEPKSKKTIEERKWQFGIDLEEAIGQPRCYNQMTIDFYDYWTEHGPNDKKMRFEKEKSFDIKKRLDRWKRNQKQPHGKQSADEAIRKFLSE